MAENNEVNDNSPSLDPNRKEILIITSMELVCKHRTSLAIFEMVRDSKNNLTKLAEIKELESSQENLKVKSSLLDAFVAGFKIGIAQLN